MRKTFLTIATFVMAMLFMASCEKKTISEAQTPSEIKTYITTHFPTHTILQIMKNRDDAKLIYDIMLSDGITLEFNRKKEIIQIDGNKNTPLPNSVIPENIRTYVNTNHPSNYIIGWELTDRENQQIDLNNDFELIFDKSGNFLRYND